MYENEIVGKNVKSFSISSIIISYILHRKRIYKNQQKGKTYKIFEEQKSVDGYHQTKKQPSLGVCRNY